MSVIKQTNWQIPTGQPEPTFQTPGFNPPVYRELLMAEGPDGEPEPYVVIMTNQSDAVRVPHGMSIDAPVRGAGNNGNPNPVAAGNARIPDVAIPILVGYVGFKSVNESANIGLLWDPSQVTTTNTGTWADESYIYLYITTVAIPLPVAFVVYVEYTHSAIKNEIVTGEYYPARKPKVP
jgi:hypothetical protein